jgi:predicted DsbA family dithiol-disulfide isomerase
LFDLAAGILTGCRPEVKRAPGRAMHIDIVSDVICPWCYIGKRRLERALGRRPRLTATRSWHAFQLNPDLPVEGVSQKLYLAAKFGSAQSAARACAALAVAGRVEGIHFAFDRIGRIPNTLRAHRLIRFAADAGAADTIVEALFHAYFVEGLDIGLIDVLAALAGRNGCDRAEVRHYLEGDAGSAEVRAADRRARRAGIHAVPCFVFERGYAISGAQEPEMFLSLFDVASGVGDSPDTERQT